MIRTDFDRVEWYSINYPVDLPPANRGTHIGMFLAWVILNDLVSEIHRLQDAEDLRRVRARKMTGRTFLARNCDGRFFDRSVNEEGRDFTDNYYPAQGGKYLSDYEKALDVKALPSWYHVADTWENYDKLAVLIDHRFAEWKQKRNRKRR